MNARKDIAAHFTSDTLVDQLLDAYRAEVLRDMAAEVKALGDARGWSIWAAHYMHPDVEFVDTGALGTGEKASATAPTATPAGPLGAGARNRLALLRRTVTDNQGQWTTRRAQRLYANTHGPGDWRATARRDLKQLHAEGLLVEHNEDPDRHHYTVNTRNGGTA